MESEQLELFSEAVLPTMESSEGPLAEAKPVMFPGKNTSSPLAAVCRHLNRSMAHIQEQLEIISQQLQNVNMDDCDNLDDSVDDVDAEITRYRQILQRMDELELDFDRMKNIREIARALQRRAERTDRVKEGTLYHGRVLRQRTARRHRLVPGVRHLRASQNPGTVGGTQQGLAAQVPAEGNQTASSLDVVSSWNDTTTLRGPQSSDCPVSGNEVDAPAGADHGPSRSELVPSVSIESHFWPANDDLRAERPPQLYGDPKNLFLGHEDLREAVAIALYRETGDGYVENPVFPVDIVNHNPMDLRSSPEAIMETDSIPIGDMGFLPNQVAHMDTQQTPDNVRRDAEAPLLVDRTESSNKLVPGPEWRHHTQEQNKMDVQYITSNDIRDVIKAWSHPRHRASTQTLSRNSPFTTYPAIQLDNQPSGGDYLSKENDGMNLVEKIAFWQNMMEDC